MSEISGEEDSRSAHFSGEKHDANANGAIARVPSYSRLAWGRGSDNRHRDNLSAMQEMIFVRHRSVPKIIGRGGSKIRELQEITGASIMISKEYSGDDVPITLSGREEEIRNARELIEDLNSGSYQYQKKRYTRIDERLSNHSNLIKKVIQIRSSHCGRIIGKGGSKIKALQEESGAWIKLKREEASDDMTPVVIRGSESCVEKAETMIKDMVGDYQFDKERSSGGSKIKTLQEEGGAWIKVKPEEASDDTALVLVRGSESCVEKAESLIKDVVGDYEFDKERSSDDPFMIKTESGIRVDWTGLYEHAIEQEKKYWENFARSKPIKKNFYIEDKNVADMMPCEAEQWRSQNFNIDVTHLVKQDPHVVLNPVLKFEQAFKHYPEILETISRQKFQKPSLIQSQAWPLALRGYDVIAIAQARTGKTLSFLLPAFIHIDGQPEPRSQRKAPSCLILTATSKLAWQIENEIFEYQYRNIRCVCVCEGEGDRRHEIDLVKQGAEIIVATPGRFFYHVVNNFVSLDSVRFLVLDKVDTMMDLDIDRLIDSILSHIRPDRQTIMTSDTWSEGVQRLAMRFLTDPMQVAAEHPVKQIVEIVAQEEKKDRFFDFINSIEENDKVMVFVGRKRTAKYLSTELGIMNVQCRLIHRGRAPWDKVIIALDDFKKGCFRILLATGFASRDLDDVEKVTHVFNYDYPGNSEEYAHRLPLAGHAGKSGTSITLVTTDDSSSADDLIDVLVEAQQVVPAELYKMAEQFAVMKERREREERQKRECERRGRGGFRRKSKRW